MIYVDFQQPCVPNRWWRWPSVSHLTCDPADDLKELHEFAAGIGLKRGWFQPRGGIMPHYDLTPGKRAAALAAGAEQLFTREDVVAKINAWRQWQAAKKQRVMPDLFMSIIA